MFIQKSTNDRFKLTMNMNRNILFCSAYKWRKTVRCSEHCFEAIVVKKMGIISQFTGCQCRNTAEICNVFATCKKKPQNSTIKNVLMHFEYTFALMHCQYMFAKKLFIYSQKLHLIFRNNINFKNVLNVGYRILVILNVR